MKKFLDKRERFYNEKEVNISSVLRDYFGMSSGSQKNASFKSGQNWRKKGTQFKGSQSLARIQSVSRI